MSFQLRVWLGWVAVTVIVGELLDYGLAIVWLRGTDLAFVMFGLGVGWAALTPMVIRAISRRLRG